MQITILDPQTRREISRCSGPNSYGGCPRVAEDGRAFCAGKAAVTVERSGKIREWTISVDAESCFVPALEILP
jgi:hypothetical protein